MLAQFKDIFFAESNKRLTSLIHYIKELTSKSPATGGFYPSVVGLFLSIDN